LYCGALYCGELPGLPNLLYPLEGACAEGCAEGRVFCISDRCAALVTDALGGWAPGSPKRRNPPLALLAPATVPFGRLTGAGTLAVAGRSLPAPEGRVPCSMARCCCENGNRCTPAGC